MKLTLTLILLILILGCKQSEKKSVELNEYEQYVLLNEYVSTDIANEKEYLVSLHQTEELNSWLLNPESYTIDSENNIELNDELQMEVRNIAPKPWPGISKTKWKAEYLEKFRTIDEDTVGDIFQINERYKTNIETIHYLSPILYNSDNNLALVVDKPILIDDWQCEPRAYYYLYLKDGSEWQSLKKYGTDNIALIMERYKKNSPNL